MKRKERAYKDLKRHKNGAFGEYAREQGVLGNSKAYKEFKKEGAPE